MDALGFLGFLAMAAEIEARGPAQAAVFSALTAAESLSLARIADALIVLVAVLLAGVLAARGLRAWKAQRDGVTIALRYPDRAVQVLRGWTVLKASRANGIPHLSLCGGRAERVALAASVAVTHFDPHEISVRGRAAPLTVYAVRSIAETGA